MWSDSRIDAVMNNQEVIYHQSEPSVPFTRLSSMAYMLTLMRDEYEADTKRLTPQAVIAAGLICAAAFVLLLFGIVKLVTR